MSRFFIILATSIALAGAGVPARAQVRMDNGNVIFGAVTLGLLAAILGDLKRKGDQMAATAPVTRPQPNTRPVPRRDPAPRPFTVKTVRTDLTGNGKPGQWHRPKPTSYYVSKRLVPAHCLRDVSRPGQSMRLLGRHCLAQANVPARSLPAACKVEVPSYDGTYVGYRPHCLRDRGYRLVRS